MIGVIELGMKGREWASPKPNVQGPKSEEISEALISRLMVHYAAALDDAIAESDEKPRNRVARLGQSIRDMVRVQRARERAEVEREQCAVERERVKMEKERLELQRAKLARQVSTADKAAGINKAPGAEGAKPTLSHQEKAAVIRQMVREL